MSIRQFATSLTIIRKSEQGGRGKALMRHLMWQGRKLMFPHPVKRRLSDSIIMDDEPGGVIAMVNMLGRYDFNNMHFVQRLLSEAAALVDPVFIDVGANIGAYTLIASEIEAARVVSLEPIPAAFAKLQRNLVLNGRHLVTTLPVAAGNKPGELRMTCNGSSVLNQVVPDAVGEEDTMVVLVDTLDAICRRMGITPSLIKIDVEGHEPEVLAGAKECLASCQACLVENGDRTEIVALMRACGMQGPFYYRHRLSKLERRPQSLPEDQVYISHRFAATFPAIAIEAW